MLLREEAVAVVAEHWNATVTDPKDEFAPAFAELTPEGDFWQVHGNTKACILDGDEMRQQVGMGACFVDAQTGALFVSGSGEDPDEVLQDIRDERTAGGHLYVLAAGTGTGDLAEVVAVRKVVPCGILRTRQMLASTERYWFQGKKRLLQAYSDGLWQLGMPNEILLVEDAGAALEVAWGFEGDLKRIAERLAKPPDEHSS